MAELIRHVARKLSECCFWLLMALIAVYLAATMRGLPLDDPRVEDARWATQVAVLTMWMVLSALRVLPEDDGQGK